MTTTQLSTPAEREAAYYEFLKSKIPMAEKLGFDPPSPCPDWFKPHQRDLCNWAIELGRAAICASFGLGKALKNGTKVLTKDGWLPIEEIVVGDQVYGSDGELHFVTGTFPQGVRKAYRVTFSDRTSISCDADHLWYMQTQGQRYRGLPGRTYTTQELVDSGAVNRRGGTRLFIPMVQPIQMPEMELPIDPYTLGVILGDGGISCIEVCLTTDIEIAESMPLPEGCRLVFVETLTFDVAQYRIAGPQKAGPTNSNPMKNALRQLGLMGLKSEEKFIPSEYLYSSIEQRTALLQGLLDTDGCASLSGKAEFCSSSEAVADGVQWLVESLGGSAVRSIKEEPAYTHNGEKRIGKPCHRLLIKMPEGFECFRLARKKEAMEPATQRPNPHRALQSIESIDDCECTCISVDSPDHLFVTEHCILTHNTVMQLQLAKWVHQHTGGKVLIICPLGVRQEFTHSDGPRMGMELAYVRTNAEVEAAETPYLITNYERVRDGGIDVSQFIAVLLDEASVLRSYGTKTMQVFMDIFMAVPYRWIATATPSPNDYIELINYAHFLGVMSRGEAMTRFFGRDSKEAGNLQLYPHMEHLFWEHVHSWAVFLNTPSELGYSDEGYALPPLRVKYHEVSVDYSRAADEIDKRNGQRRLLPESSGGGLQSEAKERRETMEDRVRKAIEIVKSQPDQHWIIWHYLEAERHLIKKLLPECRSIYGTQDLDEREQTTIDFAEGRFQYVSTKPEVSGSGTNWQRHCSRNVYVGPSNKFNDFIQSVHRTYRFLQTDPVEVHVVFAETQSPTLRTMKRKWNQHDKQRKIMSKLIKDRGLSRDALEGRVLTRSLGCDRAETSGKNYHLINNDCVTETIHMADDSVDMICTSIPFSDHYEYSPSFNDMGHNHGDEGFFAQMDFLIPELYRILKPGRIAAIHTKDRIEYGKMTGKGMYSVRPFSDKTVAAMLKHGWVYMGRIVIDTDVVRENSQTYRLGWTNNSKDSTVMGVGSTEFVLVFRKWDPSMSTDDPPTSRGPEPVTKTNGMTPDYSRSRWQIHASGIWRSNGDELLTPEKVESLGVKGLYHWWKAYCEKHGYDYPTHVEYCEMVEAKGLLPASMMLFAPHSANPDVWTDIQRIDTLNTELDRKNMQNHVCPLQRDLVLRLIERYSNPGDTILDPFGGVMTVPYVAIKAKRKGVGIELNPQYWQYGKMFLERLERDMSVPTLFDMLEFSEAGG